MMILIIRRAGAAVFSLISFFLVLPVVRYFSYFTVNLRTACCSCSRPLHLIRPTALRAVVVV